ncbi:hypothetical protein [Phenylobacterium sp.]|jgi:hypothetical protein|uniref:hypothetical protein n=1 Tax=Phenylobacterium sp. TaxID=1871053 RepID=UPI002F3ECC59
MPPARSVTRQSSGAGRAPLGLPELHATALRRASPLWAALEANATCGAVKRGHPAKFGTRERSDMPANSSFGASISSAATHLFRALASAVSTIIPFIYATCLVFSLAYFTYVYKTASLVYDDLASIQKEDLPSKAEHLYNDWMRLKSSAPLPVSPSTADSSEYYHELSVTRGIAYNVFNDQTRAADVIDAATFRKPVSFILDKLGIGSSLLFIRDSDSNYNNVTPDLTDEDGDFSTYLRFIDLTGPNNLAVEDVNNNLNIYMSWMQNIMTIYGLWVLPAIYAMFGALIFQFRARINPLLKNPKHPVTRAILAAMAGVSISWLFNSLNSKTFGGITIFGLAFLFGFSIDVFFATLDRLVTSLSKPTAAET